MKTILFYFLAVYICLNVVAGGIPDNIIKITNSETRTEEIIKYIIKTEKEKKNCSLDNNEAEQAMKLFIKIDNIKLSSFAPAVSKGRIISDALEKTIKGKKSPKEIYEEIKLEEHDISMEEWLFYAKKYTTPESIDKFKKIIPDNMDIIIETGKNSLTPLLENWLLFRKIMSECGINENINFNNRNVLAEKEKEWWRKTLNNCNLDNESYNNVLSKITVMTFFSKAEEEAWEELFKDKFAKQK